MSDTNYPAQCTYRCSVLHSWACWLLLIRSCMNGWPRQRLSTRHGSERVLRRRWVITKMSNLCPPPQQRLNPQRPHQNFINRKRWSYDSLWLRMTCNGCMIWHQWRWSHWYHLRIVQTRHPMIWYVIVLVTHATMTIRTYANRTMWWWKQHRYW